MPVNPPDTLDAGAQAEVLLPSSDTTKTGVLFSPTDLAPLKHLLSSSLIKCSVVVKKLSQADLEKYGCNTLLPPSLRSSQQHFPGVGGMGPGCMPHSQSTSQQEEETCRYICGFSALVNRHQAGLFYEDEVDIVRAQFTQDPAQYK